MLPLRVLLTGAHGLLGQALLSALKDLPCEVISLSTRGGDLSWDHLSVSSLENFDVVIHLAGENIGKGWWTRKKKERLWKSRCETSQQLSSLFSQVKNPPKVILSASAAGFYGQALDVDESSLPGTGFLADLCVAWEKAWHLCVDRGIRVVFLRFSPILSLKGGLLKQVLFPFQCGLGTILGSGEEHFSWVSLEDAVGAIIHILQHQEVTGPVNITAPETVSQREFATCLGKALGKPVFLRLPAFLIKILFGEKGRSLLLSSVSVTPKKLLSSGYVFKYPTYLSCLNHLF